MKEKEKRMIEIFENLGDIEKACLSKKRIKIIDRLGNIVEKIEPVAVESCMNPGKFNIKPIHIYIEKGLIVLDNGKETLKLSEKELENGTVKLQAEEFVPKRVKAKSHCTNCTNCGRCSW